MQPVKNATLQDFSQEEVEKYSKLRQTKLKTPTESYSESLLKKLRAVVDVAGKQVPTVSGILLFGSQPNEFIETQLNYIRCARFKGKDVGIFVDQQDIVGTLREQIDEAMAFIRKNIRFGWTLEYMPRKKMFEYPLEVVKEAITNAVAHRDLTQNATIRVAIFDDRIEVWSPGKLPEGVTIENIENACQSRNPNICQRLFEMGYIEAWGLGIDMMNREMLKAGLPKPLYAETGNSFVVTLIGPGDKWMSEKEIKLPAGLNGRQRKAVEYIREHGSITNREYRELTGLGREYTRKDLNDMVAKGILAKKGKGRSIHYILVGN
jgi:ATP-dependent DNA helicase RecG